VECLRAALSLTISIPERSRHKHGVVISDLSQFRFADSHARPVWPCLPDPHVCKSRRSLSAWLGQVPRQHSSGGKERLGGSPRQATLTCEGCCSLVTMAVIRHTERHRTSRPWLTKLLSRRHPRVTAIALANTPGRWWPAANAIASRRPHSGEETSRGWQEQELAGASCPMKGPMIAGEPTYDPALQSACNWSGPADWRTRHHGQRHRATPHQQVEDMAHPNTAVATPQPALANGAPSRRGVCG